MSIEIVRIYKRENEFSIWIAGDQKFCENDFLNVIAPLGVIKSERVFTCLGPAEVNDEIQTNLGVFNLSKAYDAFAGGTVYSDNTDLMNSILSAMLNSGEYHERK